MEFTDDAGNENPYRNKMPPSNGDQSADSTPNSRCSNPEGSADADSDSDPRDVAGKSISADGDVDPTTDDAGKPLISTAKRVEDVDNQSETTTTSSSQDFDSQTSSFTQDFTDSVSILDSQSQDFENSSNNSRTGGFDNVDSASSIRQDNVVDADTQQPKGYRDSVISIRFYKHNDANVNQDTLDNNELVDGIQVKDQLVSVSPASVDASVSCDRECDRSKTVAAPSAQPDPSETDPSGVVVTSSDVDDRRRSTESCVRDLVDSLVVNAELIISSRRSSDGGAIVRSENVVCPRRSGGDVIDPVDTKTRGVCFVGAKCGPIATSHPSQNGPGDSSTSVSPPRVGRDSSAEDVTCVSPSLAQQPDQQRTSTTLPFGSSHSDESDCSVVKAEHSSDVPPSTELVSMKSGASDCRAPTEGANWSSPDACDDATVVAKCLSDVCDEVALQLEDTREETIPSQDPNPVEHELKLSPIFGASSSNIAERLDSKEQLNNIKRFVDNNLDTNVVTQAFHHDNLAQQIKLDTSTKVETGTNESNSNLVAQTDSYLPSLRASENICQANAVDGVNVAQSSLDDSVSKVPLNVSEGSAHSETDSKAVCISESRNSTVSEIPLTITENRSVQKAMTFDDGYENISEEEDFDTYDLDEHKTSANLSFDYTVANKIDVCQSAQNCRVSIAEVTDSGLGTEASSQSDTELSNQHHTDSDNDFDAEHRASQRQKSSSLNTTGSVVETKHCVQHNSNLLDNRMMGRCVSESKLPLRRSDPEVRSMCWQIVDDIVSEMGYPIFKPELEMAMRVESSAGDVPRVTCQIPLEKLTDVLSTYRKPSVSLGNSKSSSMPDLRISSQSEDASVLGSVYSTSLVNKTNSCQEKSSISLSMLETSHQNILTKSQATNSAVPETVLKTKLTRARKKCLKYIDEKPVNHKSKILRSHVVLCTPSSSSKPNEATSVAPLQNVNQPNVPIKSRTIHPHKYTFQIDEENLMKLPGGEKLYACDICSGVYQRAFSLKRHYLRSHINYRHLTERDISNCGIVVNSNMAVSSADNTTIFMQNSKIISSAADAKTSENNIDNQSLNNQDSDCALESIRLSSEDLPSVIKELEIASVDILQDQVFDGSLKESITPSKETDVGSSVRQDCDKSSSGCVGDVNAGDSVIQSIGEVAAGDNNTLDKRRKLLRSDVSETYQSLGSKLSGCNPRFQKSSCDAERPICSPNVEEPTADTDINTHLVNGFIETGVTMPGLFRCHICGLCFDLKPDLKLHLANHPLASSGETQPYRCTTCQETFSFKSIFQRHLATHNQPEPVAKMQLCLYCDKQFGTSGILNRHISRMHQPAPKRGKRRKLKFCPYCPEIFDKKFRNLRLLFKHLISEHSDIYHGCLDCETRYENQIALDLHNQTVHGKNISAVGIMSSAATHKDIVYDSLDPESGSNRNAPVLNDSITTSATLINIDVNSGEATNPNNVEGSSFDTFQYSCAICQKMFTNYVNMCRHRRLAHGKAIAKSKRSDFTPKKYQKYETKTSGRERSPKAAMSEVAAQGSESVVPELGIDPETLFYSKLSENIRDNLLNHLDGKIIMRESSFLVQGATPAHPKVVDESLEVIAASTECDLNGAVGKGADKKVANEKYNFPKKYDTKGDCDIYTNSYNKDLSCMDICTQITVKRNVERCRSRPSETCHDVESDKRAAEDQVSFLRLLDVNLGTNQINKDVFYSAQNAIHEQSTNGSQLTLEPITNVPKANLKSSAKSIRRRLSLRQRSTDSEVKEVIYEERLSNCVSDSDNEEIPAKETGEPPVVQTDKSSDVATGNSSPVPDAPNDLPPTNTTTTDFEENSNTSPFESDLSISLAENLSQSPHNRQEPVFVKLGPSSDSSDLSMQPLDALDPLATTEQKDPLEIVDTTAEGSDLLPTDQDQSSKVIEQMADADPLAPLASSSGQDDAGQDSSEPPILMASTSSLEAFSLPLVSRVTHRSAFEFSGDWVRPRTYVCAACNSKFSDIYDLQDHKWSLHPNAWCSHYEFYDVHLQSGPSDTTGMSLELYKRFLKHRGALTSAEVWPNDAGMTCTKCGKGFTLAAEFHRHLLDCGGDTTWMLTMFAASPGAGRRNRKWRPFGSRRRRHQGRRGMKRNIPNSPMKMSLQKTRRQNDADAIQRMIANLPAKRSTRRAIQFKEDEIKTRSQATINSNRLLRKRYKVTFASSFSRSNLKSRKERPITQKTAVASILKADPPESSLKKSKFLRKVITAQLEVQPQGAIPKKLTRKSLQAGETPKNIKKTHKVSIVEPEIPDGRKITRRVRLIPDITPSVKNPPKLVEDLPENPKNVKKPQKALFNTKLKKIAARKLTLLKPIVAKVPLNSESTKTASKVNKKWIQTSINFPHRKRLLKSSSLKEAKEKRVKGKLPLTVKHPNRITRRSLEVQSLTNIQQTASPKRMGRPPKTTNVPTELSDLGNASPVSVPSAQNVLAAAIGRKAGKDLAVSLKNKALARGVTLRAAKNKSIKNAIKSRTKKNTIVKPSENVISIPDKEVIIIVPPQVQEKEVVKEDEIVIEKEVVKEVVSVAKMNVSETSDILAAMRKAMLESEPKDFLEHSNDSQSVIVPDQIKLLKKGTGQEKRIKITRDKKQNADVKMPVKPQKGLIPCPQSGSQSTMVRTTNVRNSNKLVVNPDGQGNMNAPNNITEDTSELDSLPLSIIALKDKLTRNKLIPTLDETTTKLKLRLQKSKNVSKGIENSKVNADLQGSHSPSLLIMNVNHGEANDTNVEPSQDLSVLVGKSRRIAKQKPTFGLKTEALTTTSVTNIPGCVNKPCDISPTAVADVIPKTRKTKLLLKSALLARTKNKNILRMQKDLGNQSKKQNQEKKNAEVKGSTSPANFSKEPIMCTGCGTEFGNQASCDRHQKKCTYVQKTSATSQPTVELFSGEVAPVESGPKPGGIDDLATEVSREVISCSSCHLEFKTKWGCERHERNCTIVKESDSKTISSKVEMSSKPSTELSGEPILCLGCGVEFSNHSACERHKRKCEMIPTNVTEVMLVQKPNSERKQLMTDHNKELSSKGISCFGCKRVFKGYVTCRKHQRKCIHISSHSKDYILKSKRVAELRLMKLKTVKSTTDEPSICTLCGLEFKTRAACLRHEKKCLPSLEDSTPPLSKVENTTGPPPTVVETSTSDKSLKCTVCSLKFRTSVGFSRHNKNCVSKQIVAKIPIVDLVPPVEFVSTADNTPNVITNNDCESGVEVQHASPTNKTDVVTKQTSKLLELLKPDLTKAKIINSIADPVRCSGCNLYFKTQAACDRHQRKCDSVVQLSNIAKSVIELASDPSTKDNIQPIVCKDCGSTFKNQSTCDRHNKKCHSSLQTSKAVGTNVEVSIELTSSQTSKDSDKPTICQDCGSTFKNQAVCERHRKKCDLTPQSTKTPGNSQEPSVDLENNVSTKVNTQPIMCIECGLEFKNHSSCERHQKRCSISSKAVEVSEPQSKTTSGLDNPSIETNVSFVCSFCRLMFKSQPACDRHTKNCAALLQEFGTELSAKPHTETSVPTVLKLAAKIPTPTQESAQTELETPKSALNTHTTLLKHQKKCASSAIHSHIPENGLDLVEGLLENAKSVKTPLYSCNVCGLGFKGNITCLKHEKKCLSSALPSSIAGNSLGVSQEMLVGAKSDLDTHISCTVCGQEFKEHAACLKHQNKCSSTASLPSNLHAVALDLAEDLLENCKSAKTTVHTCNVCGLDFKVHTTYLKHKKKCVSIALPSDIVVDSSKELPDNSKSATSTQVSCTVCGLGFKERSACLKHQEKCGSSTKPVSDVSPIPPASLTPKLAANMHSTPNICTVCGLEFKSPIACRKHERKCILPPKSEERTKLKTKCAGEVPMPIFKGTKTSQEAIVCSDCSLEFKSQTACARHRRKCIFAQKSRQILKVKTSGRKGVFPYFCHGCDKKFTYKGSFISHRLTCIKLKTLEEGGSEENVVGVNLGVNKELIKEDHILSIATSKAGIGGQMENMLQVEVPEGDEVDVDIPEDVPLALVMARKQHKSFKHLKKPLKRLQRPLRQLRKSPIVREKTKSSVDGVRKSSRISIARISVCNDKSDSEENMPELEIQEPIQNLAVVSPAKSGSDLLDIPILSPISDLPLLLDDKLQRSSEPNLKPVESLLRETKSDRPSSPIVRTFPKSGQETKSKTLSEKTDQQTSLSRSILMDILCQRKKPTDFPTSTKKFPNLSALLETGQVTGKPSLLTIPPVLSLQNTTLNAKLDQNAKDKAMIIPKQFPLNIPNPQPNFCILQSPIIAKPIPPEPELIGDLDEVLKINVIDVAQVRSSPEEKLKLQEMEAKLPLQDPKSDPEIEVKIKSLIRKHASRLTKKKSLELKLAKTLSTSTNRNLASETTADNISSDVLSSKPNAVINTSALLPDCSLKGEVGTVVASVKPNSVGKHDITKLMYDGIDTEGTQNKRHSKRHLKKQKQLNRSEGNNDVKSNKVLNAKNKGFSKVKSVKIAITETELSTNLKSTSTWTNPTNFHIDYCDTVVKSPKQHATTFVDTIVQPCKVDSVTVDATGKETKTVVNPPPKLSIALLDSTVQPPKAGVVSLDSTVKSSKLRAALADTATKPVAADTVILESVVKPIDGIAKSSKLRAALGDTAAKPSASISDTVAKPIDTVAKSSKLRAALRVTIAKPSFIESLSSETIVKPFQLHAALVNATVKPSTLENINLQTPSLENKPLETVVKPSIKVHSSIVGPTVVTPSKARSSIVHNTVQLPTVENTCLQTLTKPTKICGTVVNTTVKPSTIEVIDLETEDKTSREHGDILDTNVKPSTVDVKPLETAVKPSKVHGAVNNKLSTAEVKLLETAVEPSKVRGPVLDTTVKPSKVEVMQPKIVVKPLKVPGTVVDTNVKPSTVEIVQPETAVKPSEMHGAVVDSTVKPSTVEVKPLETAAKPSKVRGAVVDSTVKPSTVEVKPLETAVKPSKERGAVVDSTVKPSTVEVKPLETAVKPSKVRGAVVDNTVTPSSVEVKPLETAVKPSKVRGAAVDTVKPTTVEVKPLETAVKPSKVRGAAAVDTVKPTTVEVKPLETSVKPSKVRGAAVDTVKPTTVEVKPLETAVKPSKVRGAVVDTVKPTTVEVKPLETAVKPSKVRGAAVDTVKPTTVEVKHLETAVKPSKLRGAAVDSTVKPSTVEVKPLETAAKPFKVRGAVVDNTVKPSTVEVKPLETAVKPSEVRGAAVDSTVKPTTVEVKPLETAAKPFKVRGAVVDNTVKPSTVEVKPLETAVKPSEVRGAAVDSTVKPTTVEVKPLETAAKPFKVRGAVVDSTDKPSTLKMVPIETLIKPSKVCGAVVDSTDTVEVKSLKTAVKPSKVRGAVVDSTDKPTTFKIVPIETLIKPSKVRGSVVDSTVKPSTLKIVPIETLVKPSKVRGSVVGSTVKPSTLKIVPIETLVKPSKVRGAVVGSTVRPSTLIKIVPIETLAKLSKVRGAVVDSTVKPSTVENARLDTKIEPCKVRPVQSSKAGSVCLETGVKTVETVATSTKLRGALAALKSASIDTGVKQSNVCSAQVNHTVKPSKVDDLRLENKTKPFDSTAEPTEIQDAIVDTAVQPLDSRSLKTVDKTSDVHGAFFDIAGKPSEACGAAIDTVVKPSTNAAGHLAKEVESNVTTTRPSESEGAIEKSNINQDNIQNETRVPTSNANKFENSATPLALKYLKGKNRKESAPQRNVFEAFTYFKSAKTTVVPGNKRGNVEDSNSLASSETCHDLSTQSVDTNTSSEPSSYFDMFTSIKFKRRAAAASTKGRGRYQVGRGRGRRTDMQENSMPPSKEKLSETHEGTVPNSISGEDYELNLIDGKKSSTVGDDVSAPEISKPDPQRETETTVGNEKMTNVMAGREVKKGATKGRQKVVSRGAKALARGRSKQRGTTRGRKRSGSRVGRRTSLRSPVGRPESPVRRREGSVRRTRCYLSYEEMYTSDVASEDSRLDFLEPRNFSPVRKVASPNAHPDEDPQPKITIVEKFTYSKGPVNNDSKPSTEVDSAKEHVIKDLSDPNRFHKEEEVEDDVGKPKEPDSTAESPAKEKKQRRRNLSLDTAYYCHICSKHYYSNYNLNKHKASTLHKYNVEKVDSDEEEGTDKEAANAEPAAVAASSIISLPRDDVVNNVDPGPKDEPHPAGNNEVTINHAFGNYESVSHWLEQQTSHRNEYDWSENECAPVETSPLDEASLRELQQAMGVTDEEMMMLQHLGEGNGNAEWPQLSDLDKSEAVAPPARKNRRSEDEASDREQSGYNAHMVAEGLKSHMTSALGRLLERALNNVYTPGGELKTSPLNKPTLDLLQKLSKLYSAKTGKILNKTNISEGPSTGKPNGDEKNGNGKTLATGSPSEERAATVNVKQQPSAASEVVKVPEYKYACPICDVRFERKLSINYHIARAHKTADKYINRRKQSNAVAIKKENIKKENIKKESKEAFVKDTSDDESVPGERDPTWGAEESLSSRSSAAPPRETMPAIFTDDDVDYESPLEMLANQCFEIANRGLGYSEDSRLSTDVSEARVSGANGDRGGAKSKEDVPKIDSNKSKILQCVYLPSRKKAKLFGNEDGKPDDSERKKEIEAKRPTKFQRNVTACGTNVQSAARNVIMKEESLEMFATSSSTTSMENPLPGENTKRKNKKSKFAELNSDVEEDIRLKAEAALRDLNKRSRANQKLNWGALKFTKSNLQVHKTIGDPGRKSSKVDNIKTSPPVAVDNVTTVDTSHVKSSRDLDEVILPENLEEKPLVISDDKLAAVDVYEFEDDETTPPDLGFRHQNGVSPKANTGTPVKKTSKTLKVKHKTVKNDLPSCPNPVEKKTSDKKSIPKKQTKPKKTDYFSQSVEEEWIPPKSAKDIFHDKQKPSQQMSNAKQSVSPLDAGDTFEELTKADSKVKKGKEQSSSNDTIMSTENASQATSATKLKSENRKRKSSLSKTLPTEVVSEDIIPTQREQETPEINEEISETTEEIPKTRRGRNHVCYTEIYDDIFSDMEEYDFMNFDEEPSRKKVKKIAPKGKNKNDILSCVFGKGRRNSTITIGSDISDMDRECIAQAKSVDNEWDNGDELS